MTDTTPAPVVEQIIQLMAQCVHAFVNKSDGKTPTKKAGEYADEVANLLSEAKKTLDSVQYTMIAAKYAELVATLKELDKLGRSEKTPDARRHRTRIRKHARDFMTATVGTDWLFDPHSGAAGKLKMDSEVKEVSLDHLRPHAHRALFHFHSLGDVDASHTSHGLVALSITRVGAFNASFVGIEVAGIKTSDSIPKSC